MSSGENWQVVLHQAGLDSWAVVCHTLRTQCGMNEADARAAVLHRSEHKRVVVTRHADRAGAETTAAALLRRGFAATVETVA